MTLTSRLPGQATDTFRHQAAFYHGLDGLGDRVLPFIQEGVIRGEQVLVAMLADRVQWLVDSLGPDADRVEFVDMEELGRNPARIIPEWRRFVDEAPAGTRARGVGEPIWAGRREVEVEECRLHESLLNVAFDEGTGWELMCPYDVDALPRPVVEDAMRTHPLVNPGTHRGVGYEGHRHALHTFATPLPEPPASADEMHFGPDDLTGLRDLVRRLTGQARLPRDTAEDVVLAAHELATNSILHGGGQGRLRAWNQPGAFVVDVSDAGTINDPLVGRDLSSGLAESGRGVWMANQLCDLVQVRSTGTATVVRLFAWL